MNPGGGAGWDESPLDIQIPDDARELDRDVLAYHRELRAQRRRRWLRGLTGPVAGRGTLMPVLASILAVCLVAGAMLSVATFSPATTGDLTHPPTTAAASSQPATPKTSPAQPSPDNLRRQFGPGQFDPGQFDPGRLLSGHRPGVGHRPGRPPQPPGRTNHGHIVSLWNISR